MLNTIFNTTLAIYSTTLVVLLTATSVPTVIFALISTFICLFIFLLLLEAEFLGVAFLIIYIGAVAVMFVFALMVIDTGNRITKITINAKLISVVLLLIHLGSAILQNIAYRYSYESLPLLYLEHGSYREKLDLLLFQTYDLLLFSELVYTTYKELFLLSGALLFAAIIIVISITVPMIESKINLKTVLASINKQFKQWF